MYAAIQVAIGGIRAVIDRRPVGTIAKTEQGWWLIVTMAVMTIVAVMMPVVVPILVSILVSILVLVVVAILAIVMPVLTAVLRFVTCHRS